MLVDHAVHQQPILLEIPISILQQLLRIPRLSQHTNLAHQPLNNLAQLHRTIIPNRPKTLHIQIIQSNLSMMK
jgi:hypothetical protein